MSGAWMDSGKWPLFPTGRFPEIWLQPKCLVFTCPDWMTPDPFEQVWPPQGSDLVLIGFPHSF